jgi:hypothetical protein
MNLISTPTIFWKILNIFFIMFPHVQEEQAKNKAQDD